MKMVIPINERLLSGRKLYISQNGTSGPVIFWGMYPHRGNEVEHLRESLMEIAPGPENYISQRMGPLRESFSRECIRIGEMK